MYKRINTGQELISIIRMGTNGVIVGEGWIGKLTACFIEKYAQKKLENVSIENITRAKSISNVLIIAQPEKMGKELAERLIDICEGNVFYLSNDIKDEMDRTMMADYPDVYEVEVLLARKKELDKEMHLKFSHEIENMFALPHFPIFQEIEIETLNRCNGTCSFCPINRADDTRPFMKMKRELFESIIQQLSEIGYRGRVGLYSNNEPLLDNRIVDFARYTWEKLPNACKIIYTNGILLKKAVFLQLLEYIDILCIDLYYDKQEDEVLTENMVEVLRYGMAHTNVQEKVMLQFINRNAIRNNRGGKSKNRKSVYQVTATCMLPYIQMIVRPDGKLSLCCNDALGENTLGDLNEDGLVKAWNRPQYHAVRERIMQGRQCVEFCKNCDNYASVNTKGNEEFSKEEMKSSWDRLKNRLIGAWERL